MDIVYFGTDVFLPCFDYFLRRHRVLALYTYRHEEDFFTEEGIVERAKEAGIPVRYESITEDEIRALYSCGSHPLLYAAEYDRKIPVPEDLPGFRGVNLHSSLLPEGRSYYPIEAAMDMELPRTGLTIHELAPTLDHGPILAQRSFPILPSMDSVDIYLTIAALARTMTEEMMEDFEGAWERAAVQTGRSPYWKRPLPERLTLTHTLSRAEAEEMFRRFNSMTQIDLDGQLYYVRALNTGSAALPYPVWRLREDHVLYALSDGHARLWLHPKTGDDRT